MSLLPPVGWADVAMKADLRSLENAIRAELHLEISGVRGEMAQLAIGLAELRGEFGELRGEFGELRGEFGELRSDMAELRGDVSSEIAALEGRMTTALRQQLFALLGAMFTITGLASAGVAAIV